MAQPARHQVEWNPFSIQATPKPVSQPFGARLGASAARPCHDRDDARVRGFQAPRPEIRAGGAVAKAMHQIEKISSLRLEGHTPSNWRWGLPGQVRVVRKRGHRIDGRAHQLLRVLILAEVGQHLQIRLQAVRWPIIAEEGRRLRQFGQ
jgi:hypothetical protein